MSEPLFVLISDVHFNIKTLDRASKALKQACDKAVELRVPLVIAGDLHDTKANLRAECINAIISILDAYRWDGNHHDDPRSVYAIVGNHDLVNEKSDQHALGFLHGVAVVIEKPVSLSYLLFNKKPVWFVPYDHDAENLRKTLTDIEDGSLVIMHQGVQGSDSGEYYIDHSALTPNDVARFRVISGHYHQKQSIDAVTYGTRPNLVGRFSYLGNPYTLGFGEAEHPTKGFGVLMDDGTLVHVPTDLPAHSILRVTFEELHSGLFCVADDDNDILWVKVQGTAEELSSLSKDKVARLLMITGDFKLTFEPLEQAVSAPEEKPQKVSDGELLDALIDTLSNTEEDSKARLKTLWKTLMS